MAMEISKASVELLKKKGLVLPSLMPVYAGVAVVASVQPTANWNGALVRKSKAVCCIKLWVREEGMNGM